MGRRVPSPKDSDRTRKEREAERYREATTLAVEQLEWCIRYLQRISKSKIAAALRHNLTTIVKRYGL
jgi:hypothetical protein